ncbi:MAG TPA: HRDC domain-containing protein, partial [Methylocella sp.]|nr:HRDC domain-containing protein [Methylocella sp.]
LQESKHFGALARKPREQVTSWIMSLIQCGWLKTTAEIYPRLMITEAGRRALAENHLLPLADCEDGSAAPESLPVPDPVIVERLRRWRREKARSMALSAYMILHNSVIEEIARQQPQTPQELIAVKGMGLKKAEQYGDEILALLRSHDPIAKAADSEALPWLNDLRLQIEVWRHGGEEPDSQALLKALENPHELAQNDLAVIINALADLGIREAADALLQLLKETPSGSLLACLSAAMWKLKVMDAAPDLVRLLEDVRPGVRRAAARAPGGLRVAEALDSLSRLAEEDDSESVRLAARAATVLIHKAG